MTSKYMSRLIKRHNYLVERIVNSDKDLSHDKAEAQALHFAVSFMHENYILAEAYYEQYKKEHHGKMDRQVAGNTPPRNSQADSPTTRAEAGAKRIVVKGV